MLRSQHHSKRGHAAMANPEHLEILKQGVEQWNKWRKGHPPEVEHPDLSGADLGEADLSGAYLREAKLGGAYLHGTNLSAANLGRADLSQAILSGANLD